MSLMNGGLAMELMPNNWKRDYLAIFQGYSRSRSGIKGVLDFQAMTTALVVHKTADSPTVYSAGSNCVLT